MFLSLILDKKVGADGLTKKGRRTQKIRLSTVGPSEQNPTVNSNIAKETKPSINALDTKPVVEKKPPVDNKKAVTNSQNVTTEQVNSEGL